MTDRPADDGPDFASLLAETPEPEIPAEVDVDAAYLALSRLTCPYRLRVGICGGGCREEPACMTDEPQEGWAGALRRAVGRGDTDDEAMAFRDMLEEVAETAGLDIAEFEDPDAAETVTYRRFLDALVEQRDAARDLAFRAAFAPEEGEEVRWGIRFPDDGTVSSAPDEDRARRLANMPGDMVMRRVLPPWKPVPAGPVPQEKP